MSAISLKGASKQLFSLNRNLIFQSKTIIDRIRVTIPYFSIPNNFSWDEIPEYDLLLILDILKI